MPKYFIRLLRLPEVLARTGSSRSGHYANIAAGTMVPAIAIGERAVAWLEHEVDTILRARVAGRDEAYLRDLVNRLVADRTSADSDA